MHPVWDWLVAIYLFLGGLGAGAFLVAATLELTGKRYKFDFCPISLVGATLPGPLVALGAVLLVFDLGAGFTYPGRIFYMFTHFSSAMTWGIWILSVFILLSLLYGFLEVMDTFLTAWVRRWKRLAFLQRLPVRPIKRVIAAVGAVFAVATAVYTGVLLSAVGPAIPFWSTSVLSIPVMPLLFLVSAISTGVALTVDLSGNLAMRDMHEHLRHLPVIQLALVALEAILLALLLFTAIKDGGTSAQSAQDILSGPRSLVFWILMVVPGLALPFVYHAITAPLHRHSRIVELVLGICILVAGLVLRYLVLVSGIPATL